MTYCGVDSCENSAVVQGMCRKHYMRLKRKGSTSDTRKNARRECIESGCGNLAAAHGLCDRHYRLSRYVPTTHEGRHCALCSDPIPKERNSRSKYCGMDCKIRATQSERNRRYRLKNKYGLTESDFQTMLDGQGGGCAICHTTSPGGRAQQFCVDHDHTTGRVRGILCSECNNGIGKLGDDPALLEAAARYLREHQEARDAGERDVVQGEAEVNFV